MMDSPLQRSHDDAVPDTAADAYDAVRAPAPAPDPQVQPLPTARTKRKPLLLLVLAIMLLLGAGYAVYHWLFAANKASTDNAYVGADVAQITPLIGGQIVAVEASDTQSVRRGQLLLRIDDSDQRIAVQQAEADLAAVQRRYNETAANGDALAAKVRARDADIASARAQLSVARANLQRAEVDYQRRRVLAAAGAASGDELTTAINALQTAQANMAAARAGIAQAEATRASALQDRAANSALTSGTTMATAPAVLTAGARLRQARLDLARTVVRAPIDGIVAQRNVQVGQRVAVGIPAMAIVPLRHLYVDANFKEVQLGRVRIGQRVRLTSDLYGGSVVFHGRVLGLGGGTGAAFALIPAQNATGNWIKVVQRLPVRIVLDPAELDAHPLRVGLSMDATVDLGDAG